MKKKIGRNEPCPCGTGKKYKKCCINLKKNLDLPPRTNKESKKVFKFIESYNSAQLLDFVIGLQLLPENHGKNIRIEKLATHIVQNLNDNAKGNLSLFKEYLDEEYEYNPMEDLPENLFCENVVFFAGNYTVFSGIYGYAIETFKNLSESIFLQNNTLPNGFKSHVYSGITLILNIGQTLCQKFNISGNIKDIEGGSKLDYSFELQDTSFSQDEILRICSDNNIDPEIFNDFVISPNDERFSLEDPDLNPLLYHPIILHAGRYYFALISNQINALNEFIFRLSDLYDCNKELVSLYHKKLWEEQWGACNKMGWQLTDILLPENTQIDILKERIYQFDTNRIAYSCYFHNSSIKDKYKVNNSIDGDFDLNQRINKVVTALKNDKKFQDYKILTLINYETMGRNLYLKLERPQENELRIMIPIHQFNLLCNSEDWHNLSLWKFAKSHKRFSKITTTALTDTLDIYSIYKANDQSFYFGDDARPNFLTVLPGDGSRLIKDAKIKNNGHGIFGEVGGKKGYTPSEKYADYAPLYKPLFRNGYYAICLESFRFPIWITNHQVQSKEMFFEIRNFAEAIAFWLYKLKNEISTLLEAEISDFLKIKIILEDIIFENKQTKDIIENSDDNQYTFALSGNTLDFTIPFSKIKSFIGSNNLGEREMMRALLNGFNTIEQIHFSDEFINQALETAIPLGSAKMILLSDIQENPLSDNRWLISPKYISNSEIERTLDELPMLIEQTRQIPVNIKDPKDKKELFNTATQLLLETLSEEIKIFEFEFLLISLIELHETLVWKREHNKTLIPAQILCFGDLDGKLEEIRNDGNKLVKTSLATRCLIEYIASNPTKGTVAASFDDIDRLLVLMHEIVNYGFLSDAVHFKLANPTVGKLKSGRIGISREFFDDKLKPFAEAHTKEEVDNFLANFENRFEISTFSEISSTGEIDKEIDDVDNAFLEDWGISYLNICKFCISCYVICIENKSSTRSMNESEFVKKLVDEFELPKEEVINGLIHFSISARPEYLEAPDGFNNNEVFPWKYNREFSFARRFLIKHINEEGKSIITWGFRNAISAQKQLHYLLYEGKLNNGGKNINKLLGKFRERKGKVFRNKVKDWLKVNENLVVIDYEVDISPNGHLKADKKYGDVDILVYCNEINIVWSLECKDTNKAKNIHEMKKEMDNYLGREGAKGMIKKHIERHEWLEANSDKICDFLKIDKPIEVISYMLTSEVIPTSYTKAEDLPMPIIAFPDLKREGLKLLYPTR